MEIACPACQLAIDVRRSSFGMKINCPGCGETFRVAAGQELADPADVWITDDNEPPAAAESKSTVPPAVRPAALPSARAHAPSSAPQQTKTCPMCGQKEEPDARRCRACGEMLA